MIVRPHGWFRFSLRTMFILVTAICCWLAWESSVVRGRQAVLRELRARPGIEITTAEARAVQLPPGTAPPPAARVSLVRRWLGDQAIQEIAYAQGYHNLSRADLDRIARTFPEAKLREFHMPLEPCHPGCFPSGTPVATPQGERAIETIGVGDALTAVLPGGQTVTVNVQSIFVTRNRLWTIETEDGVLRTTEQQPLCMIGRGDASDGTTSELVDSLTPLPAGQLQPGDRILRRTSGEVRAVKVLNISRTDRIEKVFNLVLGNSEVFVAGGFLARSKPPAD
jgi:hypothetical protein